MVRWLIAGFGGFVCGLFLPVREYREYGVVSPHNMLMPLITTVAAVGLLAIARFGSRRD